MTEYPIDSSESRKYAREIAEDAHNHYFNDEGHFQQRNINHALATLANEDREVNTDMAGKITTTQHNEKVILDWDDSQDFHELGSYGIELNKKALSVETLESEERIDRLTEWILNTARSIRDQAEDAAESYINDY